jgi:hypothetical protein
VLGPARTEPVKSAIVDAAEMNGENRNSHEIKNNKNKTKS